MIITVALDNIQPRNLRLFEGDQVEFDLVVYEHDGDIDPIAPMLVTGARFVSDTMAPMLLVGSRLTVPRTWYGQRSYYRLAAEVNGFTTTLCYGVITTAGPFGGAASASTPIAPSDSQYADQYADGYS